MTDIENTVKYCPVELSLDLITKKWVVQLIRDMLFGKSHFNEFKEDKDITNKVLSRCLKQMEENGLLTKTVNDNSTEYNLTKKGKALNKVVYELGMFTVDTDENNKYYSEESKEEIRKLFKEKLDIK